jgi:hypothetical protein
MTTNEPSIFTAFISHKAKDYALARAIATLLMANMERTRLFLSDEIPKGNDWRKAIQSSLDQCDCLIMIYTDPTEDWGWCLYEAGYFDSKSTDSESKRIFCLHHPSVQPPDPLANRQTIPATEEEVLRWLVEDFYPSAHQTKAFMTVGTTAPEITRAILTHLPMMERSLVRPAFSITPLWSDSNTDDTASPIDWNRRELPEVLPLERSRVRIDGVSAILLGFDKAREFELLNFLQILDNEDESHPIWIEKFLRSLDTTIRGRILAQEITYFRHESGRILRPIIYAVDRARDGSSCECHAMFIDAFSTPPDSQVDPLQMLANGVRLATRFRVEVLNRYLDRMDYIYENKVANPNSENSISHNFSVGTRLLEAIQLILQEADAQNLSAKNDPPKIFYARRDQEKYEEIWHHFIRLYPLFVATVKQEDAASPPKYEKTNEYLRELDRMNREYMALALPRLKSVYLK